MPRRKTEDDTTVIFTCGEEKPVTVKASDLKNIAGRFGHNSGRVNNAQLKYFIQRIERLNEDIAAVQEDRKVVFAEAKSMGFDTKTMRQIIALRRMKEADRAEREALIDTYKAALGMLADTPLGRAAMEGSA